MPGDTAARGARALESGDRSPRGDAEGGGTRALGGGMLPMAASASWGAGPSRGDDGPPTTYPSSEDDQEPPSFYGYCGGDDWEGSYWGGRPPFPDRSPTPPPRKPSPPPPPPLRPPLPPSLPPMELDEVIVIEDGDDHGGAEMRLRTVLATGTAAGLSGRQAAQEWFVNTLSSAGHVMWPASELGPITFLASRTPTQPVVKYPHVLAFLGLHKKGQAVSKRTLTV